MGNLLRPKYEIPLSIRIKDYMVKEINGKELMEDKK